MLFAIWRLLLFVLFSTLEHTAWPPCCFRVWHLPRSQQKTKHVYLIPNQVEPDDKLLTNRGNGESRGALFWEFRTWDHKSCCPWHNWQRDNEDGKPQLAKNNARLGKKENNFSGSNWQKLWVMRLLWQAEFWNAVYKPTKVSGNMYKTRFQHISLRPIFCSA